MQAGVIRQRSINDEMREAYLDYAMSVIVSRALPDARDGLKPVHRRILYAMHTMGSGPATPYRKSARIVGEVLGKYHPHGDVAVYDAMVRMAQDFSMRYELVDGQGNFGSIDGDGPAAMRYTEARIADLGARLLDDLEKQTVDFSDNFDGSLQEPIVLPASIPNLIVNGSSGIAVGMSTNIPPHNLGEVCDAVMYMLDNWQHLDEVNVHDLMQFIKGPDFPTGGLIYTQSSNGENQLLSAYATGRGKITMRAKAHLEELGRGRVRIIITEIPFQTNKNNLLERIAELVQIGKIEGLANMRDESDREGLRIVIELMRTADAAKALADLFKYTPLEATFGVIMLALVDGEPRMLTLKQALRIYIEHRLEIIRRRSQYDLANAQARAHIVEGLLVALNDIDRVIAIIRNSETPDAAREELQHVFDFSEIQARAILDMRLRRLAALERHTLQEEYNALVALIRDLQALLSSEQLMRLEIKRELKELREKYTDYRRTVIVNDIPSDVRSGDLLLPQEETYTVMTHAGQLSRTYEFEVPKFRKNNVNPPVFIHAGTTADTLYLCASDGRVATVPVSQLNQQTDSSTGDSFSRLCDLSEQDKVVALFSLPPTIDEGYLFLTTRLGEVKRIRLEDLPGMRVQNFSIFNIAERDQLFTIDLVSDNDEVMLISRQSQAIRFKVSDVRPTGLAAGGMRGMRLKDDDDWLIGAGVVRSGGQVVVITHDGHGKRTPVDEYPLQGRAGGGVRTFRPSKGQPTELVAAAIVEPATQALLLTNQRHTLLTELDKAPEFKRDFRGERFVAVGVGESIIDLHLITPRLSLPDDMPLSEGATPIYDGETMAEGEFSNNGKDHAFDNGFEGDAED